MTTPRIRQLEKAHVLVEGAWIHTKDLSLRKACVARRKVSRKLIKKWKICNRRKLDVTMKYTSRRLKILGNGL